MPKPERGSTRRLRRFFSPTPIKEPGQTVQLSPAESHHLHIMRFQAGDPCLLIDEKGIEARARIVKLSQEYGVLLEIETITNKIVRSNALSLKVFLALPQKGKIDDLVRKGQELGVDEISPLETRHSMIKMTSEKKASALQRWNRIIREAAKQSGNAFLMQISEPMNIAEALSNVQGDEFSLLLHPDPAAETFQNWLHQFVSKPSKRLNLWIGPEGGFSRDEVAMIREKSNMITLGPRILKVDTAFISMVGAIRLLWP